MILTKRGSKCNNLSRVTSSFLNPARKLLEKKPEDLLRFAVKGMLPRNNLGRKLFKKLKVYKGTEHPHDAQKPETWVLK